MPLRWILIVFASSGCVSLPSQAPSSTNPPSEESTLPSTPDAGIDDPSVPASDVEEPAGADAALTVDTTAEVTEYTTIGISGSGPASGVVLIHVNGVPSSGAIGAEGTFCVDVTLQADQVNAITIQALSATGAYSDVIARNIRHITAEPEEEVEPEPEAEEVPSENLLRGVQPTDFDAPYGLNSDSGSWSALTDGQTGTYVEAYNANYNTYWNYLAFELPERSSIDRVVIRSASCQLQSVIVRVSDVEAPDFPGADMNPYQAGSDSTEPGAEPTPEWTTVVESTVGIDVFDHDFDPTVARWVAILVPDTTTGCSTGWFSGLDLFYLREIEVWSAPAAPEDSGPPPQTSTPAPTCANL